MKTFIIDYAYGFHARTCDADYVSRLRSLAAMRAFKRYPEAHIILSAGLKERTGNCGSLADMMRTFLIAEGVPTHTIYKNPNGHDTLTETEAAQAVVASHGGGNVIICTSAFHAPRVWLIWVLRFGMRPKICTSKLRPSVLEYLLEGMKLPRDIARSLTRRMTG